MKYRAFNSRIASGLGKNKSLVVDSARILGIVNPVFTVVSP